jgi:LEA14-like dessication related protein
MPTVEPVGLDVDAMTWERVDAHVDLRADNPWPIDLTVLKVAYTVRVDGEQVATGSIDTPKTIPARGRLKVPLPVAIDTMSAVEALSDGPGETDAGATGVVLAGEVTIDTPLGPTVLPIELGREVPVLQEPSLKKPWARVKNLDLINGTVDLVFGFKVVNPNDLALSIRQVDYGLRFSGATIIAGQAQRLDLAASGPSAVELPVRIDASAVGRGVVKAFQTGRISGAVWLDGKVQTPWKPIDLELRRSGKVQVWN